MNAPMTTAPNAALPIAGWREKAKRALTEDMTPEGWRGLIEGLLEFLAEEAQEPEHAGDAEFNEADHPRGEGGKFTVAFEANPGKFGTKEYQSKQFPSMEEAVKHAKEQGWHVGGERNRQEHPEIIKYAFGHEQYGSTKPSNVMRFHPLDYQGHSPGALVEREHAPKPAQKPPDPVKQVEVSKPEAQAEAAPKSEEKPKEKPPKNPDETWTAYRKRMSRLGFDGGFDMLADAIEGCADAALALDRESVRTKDIDGRLHVADVPLCRESVDPYAGKEIPGYRKLGLEPDKIYRLWRPAEELEKALPTISGIPVLRKHIATSAEDHKFKDTIGATGTSARWEAPFIKDELVIWAAPDIELIENREKFALSPGYRYEPVMEDGDFEGQHYDGRMTKIVFNHVAVVEHGRQAEVAIDSADELQWRAIERAITALAA